MVTQARQAAALEREAEDHPDPKILHALALLEVSRGELDAPVSHLQKAIAGASSDVTLLSDLAVAYLARGKSNEDLADLWSALQACEEALRIDASYRPALFNRALALDALSLRQTFAEAVEKYLSADPGSPWSAELTIREDQRAADLREASWSAHRKVLTAAIEEADVEGLRRTVKAFGQQAREDGEIRWLGAWADAALGGDESVARRWLHDADVLGAELATASDDRMLHVAVAQIVDAENRGETARLSVFARGHQKFRDAAALAAESAYDEAEPIFHESEAALRSARSPFALWATYYGGVCAYYRHDYDRALAIFRTITDVAARQQFRSLLGRAQWSIGLTLLVTGMTSNARPAFERALKEFARLGERENEAAVRCLLSDLLIQLGNSSASQRELLHALGNRDSITDLRRLHAILYDLAIGAAQVGATLAASDIVDEMHHVAAASGDPVLWTEVLRLQLMIPGASSEASTAHVAAETIGRAQRIRDPALKQRALAQAHLALAIAHRGDDPRLAIREATEALEYFDRSGYSPLKRRTLRVRAASRLMVGDGGGAEADLRRAIALRETEKAFEGDPITASLMLREDASVFDEMITLKLHQQRDPWGALAYADGARAAIGSILRHRRDGNDATPPPVDLAAIQSVLHPDEIMLVFAVLEKSVVRWAIAVNTAECVELALDRESLASDINNFRAGLVVQESSVKTRAGDLYTRLLGDLAPNQLRGARLLLVPDKVLFGLPWAALCDERTGRWLVQDHPIAVVPSIALFVSGRLGGITHADLPASVLVLVNPATDDSTAMRVSRLPAAIAEAREIAADYPRARLLVGRDAIPSAVLDAESAEVLHVAAHERADRVPERSALLLASDPAFPGGELRAEDIARAQFPHLRVVVLAACDSSGGSALPADGLIGLSTAFLGAGAESVVGALWAVPDASTEPVMTGLHRALRRGVDSATALQAAQIEALDSPQTAGGRPLVWAAFQVVVRN